MEIRDYLRMLRRGWPAILAIAAIALGLAAAYLTVAPRTYDATTTLLVSAYRPTSVEDLQAGNTFASYQVTTYAQIIDSSTVLAPVAAGLRPQRNVDDLVGMISASVRPETTLIDVTATGNSPELVAEVANEAGESAAQVLPALQIGADNTTLVRVQQIRRAVEPTEASSPRAKRVLALGLVVGLFVGLAWTIAFQTLDTRIRRLHDVRQLSGIAVLAVLPKLGRAGRQSLIVRDDPSGAVGDAFRTLRTNLRSVEPRGRRSLAIAPVAETTVGAVPANLAWALAQTGSRVLLIDLDLRRSAIGDLLGIRHGSGATDVLLGHVEIEAVVHQIDNDRLGVILSGTEVPNPSELLSSSALARMLRAVEAEYDHVVLSAPAVLGHTDAAVISAAAGGAILTIANGRTRAQELTTALGTLGAVRVTPLGLVLTRANGSTLDHRGRRLWRTPRGRVRSMHQVEWESPYPKAFDAMPARDENVSQDGALPYNETSASHRNNTDV